MGSRYETHNELELPQMKSIGRRVIHAGGGQIELERQEQKGRERRKDVA